VSTWIFGQVFFRKFHTVFDMTQANDEMVGSQDASALYN